MNRTLPSIEETLRAYAAATRLAIAITRSEARARDVVQDAFERWLTTRPWDADRVAFEEHMMGVVRSLLNNEHRSVARRREGSAHEAFYGNDAGRRTQSPEDAALQLAETNRADARAASQLERLTGSVAHQPLASAVLRCRTEGMHKAADIAAALEVRVEAVYRANEVLRAHLAKIREAE